MSKISEICVSTVLESYTKGDIKKREMFDWAEKLRILQEEVSDLAFELIARYQPVARDLRYIRSCLEVSYVLSRFGGYGYEIVEVLDMMGSISECDKSVVTEAAKVTSEMISLSVSALDFKDQQASDKLYDMDDTVDNIYRQYLKEIVTAKRDLKNIYADPRCVISALHVLRYLERVADHACYIADSVSYIVTGKSNPRRVQMNP
ncbi:MAG TPA: phosphate uptake regulator PhoU [Nitrososphaeraceae archaeon]|jgi:phosphate transport system protein|nr:phosphate uptake regulator PhoU [Nitrososphaeraceae archaeon]